MFKITKIRQNQNLTQGALSRMTEISACNICRLENGKVYPYPGWRKRIGKALNVDPDILFKEVENNVQK